MKQIYRNIQAIVDDNGEIHKVEGTKVTVQNGGEEGLVENGIFYKVWVEGEIDKLEDAEISFLIKIMKYVNHRDNTIRMGSEVMTVKEMAKATGREYTRLSRMVNGLIEKRVMGRHSTEIIEYAGRRKTVYSINPYIMCKGRMINKQVMDYFIGSRGVRR